MMRLSTRLCLVGLLGLAFVLPGPEKELEIGAKAPLVDLKMRDVSGKMLSLKDVAGENGLLVIFSCNTCPWVAAWEDRYLIVAQKAKELGIGMIAVNSNEAYREDRKSTRLNSSHVRISYAVFCLKKKNEQRSD